MQLQPQNYFTVVRQIANHTDVSTYYVQAVIRNAYTDAIIATLNLTDKGSQRFKYDWMVPADPSGQGFYISIVTSVYTDSGYTTKSDDYGDEETTYLVQERVLHRGGGGLGMSDVRRIIKEELDKHTPDFSPITGALGALQREINRVPKDQPEVRWDDVLKAISDVRSAIKEPEPAEPVDFSPVLSALGGVQQDLAAKEVTPETDLSPISTKLDQLITALAADHDDLRAAVEDIPTKVEEIVQNTQLSVAPMHLTAKTEKPQKPEPTPFDIKQLAL